MIQITGLTKVYRRGRPPALLDLTFDVRPGAVTALLGPEDSGKSTAVRLMLELERGQGVTLFGGRTYRGLRRPERQVGVVLPTVGSMAGHPGRTARGHLRMLAAAAGVPTRRADELLEQTRLATVAGHRLRAFSTGMNRRLLLAGALLGDPGTLVLDAPTEGLSPRNVEWFHSFLRSFGVAGGTVLMTTRTPQEAAQVADRVVTLDQGRLVADQSVADFCSTRLRPEVSVRGPQMARLADLLLGQGALVRRDGAVGLAVAGIDRAEIGELAYRHGILLHELADRVVEQPAPRAVLPASSGRSGQVRVQQARPDGRGSKSPRSAAIPQAAQGSPAPPVQQDAHGSHDGQAAETPQAVQDARSAQVPQLSQALPVLQAASGPPHLPSPPAPPGSPVPSSPSTRPTAPVQPVQVVQPVQPVQPVQSVPQGRQEAVPEYVLHPAPAGLAGAGAPSRSAAAGPDDPTAHPAPVVGPDHRSE